MKHRLVTLISASILFIGMFGMVGMAHTAVLTFDDMEVAGTGVVQIDPYIDQGFQLTAVDPHNPNPSGAHLQAWQQGNANYNTTAALYCDPIPCITTLSATDGSLFNLNSIDLTSLWSNWDFAGKYPIDVTFRAYNSNNQLIATEGSTLYDYSWVTFTFSSAFNNVAYVEWDQVNEDVAPYHLYAHQFDNINVSAVPLPAAIWLFGSGLIGLIGIARRKKA